jgi:hypothetical protein
LPPTARLSAQLWVAQHPDVNVVGFTGSVKTGCQIARDAQVGPGRIVALHDRSSTLYQCYEENRCLCFWSDNATEPYAQAGDAAKFVFAEMGGNSRWR